MLNIQKNIPLAPYTSFKIGGEAKYFCEVSSEEEIIEALNYAKKNNLEVFVLGGGSNVLVSDEGFDGLVIRIIASNFGAQLRNSELSSGSRIECWAGDSLSEAVRFSENNFLTGLEWAAGIPGSVGGAIRGNAGAFGSDMGKITESVKVIKMTNQCQNINVKIFNNKDCKFDYRNSVFKENKNFIILSCVFKLQKGEKTEIENKIKEIIIKRTEKQPQGLSSAGSFFQNPVVENQELIKRFEKDAGVKCKDNKIPAAWLIEEAGLKGKRIGGTMVSEKHANFVINTGGAKAQEVVMLASLIKQKVRDEFGVELKEEVQYVVF